MHGMDTVERLRTLRRDLHRIPEIGFDLPETIAYVSDVLARLTGPVEVFMPCPSTVCAFFDRGAARTTAIRTDMDALPVVERTGAPYASAHPGRMHACGHDGHMAMVLALAEHLDAHLDELSRNVLLIFQPAEESVGGALPLCESGVFERCGVDRVFGFHLWPDLPAGTVATREGALLASTNEVDVVFHGRSSHIAKADQGRDAVEAACRYLARIYAFMDGIGDDEPSLLKFGRIEGGLVHMARLAIIGSLMTGIGDFVSGVVKESFMMAPFGGKYEGHLSGLTLVAMLCGKVVYYGLKALLIPAATLVGTPLLTQAAVTVAAAGLYALLLNRKR